MCRKVLHARGRQLLKLCRLGVLGIAGLTATPAFGQDGGLQGVPPSPTLPAPTLQGAMTAPEVAFVQPAPEKWEAYVKSGIVCTLTNGFVEKQVSTGWTIRAGLQEPLCAVGPKTTIFHDLSTNYSTNSGDAPGHAIAGAFRGENPSDDHIHFFNDLYTTRLDSLRRASVDYAIGANYSLMGGRRFGSMLDGTLRTGLRLGVADADYTRTRSADAQTEIEEHLSESHGHQNVSVSTDGGRDPGFLFGLYTAVGVKVTLPETRLIGNYTTQVTLGVEVEFAKDWIRLGDFSPGDNGLSTIVPLFSLGITF